MTLGAYNEGCQERELFQLGSPMELTRIRSQPLLAANHTSAPASPTKQNIRLQQGSTRTPRRSHRPRKRADPAASEHAAPSSESEFEDWNPDDLVDVEQLLTGASTPRIANIHMTLGHGRPTSDELEKPQLAMITIPDVPALPHVPGPNQHAPWEMLGEPLSAAMKAIANATNTHPGATWKAIPRELLSDIWRKAIRSEAFAESGARNGTANFSPAVHASLKSLWLPGMSALPLHMYTAILVTDGSCKDSSGGYAAIIFSSLNVQTTAPSVVAVCGGAPRTTSGAMELTATLLGLHHIHCHLPHVRNVLILTDYMTLVTCQWGIKHIGDWRDSQNSYLWERIHALLTHFHSAEFRHVKAHDESKPKAEWAWKTLMNDQADALANAAREAVENQELPATQLPTEVLPPHAAWTDDHARASFLAALSMDELRAAISTINTQSAPGPDGIPLKIFKLFSTENLEQLLEMFETVRSSGIVPTAWKQSRITLIYKKGPPELVANWRPITVQKSITLLFTKILVRRLLTLLWQLKAIPMTQKCNVQNIAGVNEHCFLLRAILEDMQTKARLGLDAIAILIFTDVNKAFDSVQRGTLIDVLREILGDVEPFIRVIASLYADARIILTDEHGMAAEIAKRAGIHQGDALSAILYILVSESARRQYENRGRQCRRGYIFLGDYGEAYGCTKIDYEDDDTQCCNSVAEAEETLAGLTQALRKVFLSLNAAKCNVLALRTNPRTRQVEAFDPHLNIEGTPLKALKLNEPLTSLGLTFTATGDNAHGQAAAITAFYRALTQLHESTLLVGKKISLLKMVVVGKIEHQFRNVFFSAAALKHLDAYVCSTVRKWLRADGYKINNAFLYASQDEGGLELPNLQSQWEILYLVNFAHMVCAHDPVVRHAAWAIVHTSQIGLRWNPSLKTRRQGQSDHAAAAVHDHDLTPRDRLLNNLTRRIPEEAPPKGLDFFGWARMPASGLSSQNAEEPPSSLPTNSLTNKRCTARAQGVCIRASMALQYAQLSAKLGVGFHAAGLSHPRGSASTDSADPSIPSPKLPQVSIYCDGSVVDGPFALREVLVRRHKMQCSQRLAAMRVVAGAIDKPPRALSSAISSDHCVYPTVHLTSHQLLRR